MVFLLNVPVMLLWGASVWKTDRFGVAFGAVAAITQGFVMRIMIVRGIGDDEAVYAINGGIIVFLILLLAMCWIFQRRRRAMISERSMTHYQRRGR